MSQRAHWNRRLAQLEQLLWIKGESSRSCLSQEQDLQKPIVMVIAALWWPTAGRIAIMLAKVGFRVAVVSPPGSVIRKIKSVDAHYTYLPWAGLKSITRAIEACSPDFLICSDEQAVTNLHHLHSCASKAKDDPKAARLVELIEASLGDPASFALARKKAAFMECAHSVGVRYARTTIVPNESSLESELFGAAYPIVIKADGIWGGLADGSWGGRAVRIVWNKEEARKAFHDLETPFSPFTWLKAVVRSIDSLSLQPFLDRILEQRRAVMLQDYVVGRCANRAVVCLDGKSLAGISVEAHETADATGPATVVRIINHAEMSGTVEIMVKRLGLTGFYGFDFIVDSANQAWLIEMNPRLTPTCHLSLDDGTNLSAALFSRITGARTIPRVASSITDKIITLFPQGSVRSPSSAYQTSCYHDVPWEELDYVRACLRPGSSASLMKRWLRPRTPAAIGEVP